MKKTRQSLAKIFIAHLLLVLLIPGTIGFVFMCALNKWSDLIHIAARAYGAAAVGGLMLACVTTLAAAYARSDEDINEN